MTPDWLQAGPVAKVLARLEDAGHQAFVVGGAVRNALMGRPIKDFDVATSARPDAVAQIFRGAGKVLLVGADHGTVTAVVDDLPIEITTFRRDVATDGRRAVIAFADSVEEDAQRRDFTMNAIYMDRRGRILDPVGGQDDIKAGRLRFIGRAEDRIVEDYLRSLRFFRLTAEYGGADADLDADSLAAIAAHVEGLAGLSVERVTSEVMRLLAAPDPGRAVAAMAQSGVLAAILPGAQTAGLFELIEIERQAGLAPDGIRRLVALTPTHGLRLSRKEDRSFALLHDLRGGDMPLAGIAWHHGAEVAWDVAALRNAGISQPLDPDIGQQIAEGALAKRPISAHDLMPDLCGASLGRALDRATEAWIRSGFALDRDALIKVAKGRG